MNQLLTGLSGSKHGMLNPGSLEHLFEQVQGFLFGQEQYPGIVNKAALIFHRIARAHIFIDGNKRTATMACLVFLNLNGLKIELNYDETLKLAVNTASGDVNQKKVQAWLENRLTKSF